jgi:lysophospholipase L1-like esterase
MKKAKETPKAPAWFYVILVLIPLLFFLLLELFLRIIDYGDDYTQWVKVTESKYTLNPGYTRKFFFTTENVPHSIGHVFDIEKKENAFRVFILGGSSAAGFPFTPAGDFGKYIQRRLEILYPENQIEVVNIAITAVNSYALRDLIKGVAEQSPDLVIIYAGHNEYYGALGAGSTESVGSSRGIVNFIIYLNNFKTTQLVRNTLKWFSGMLSDKETSRGGTLMARMAKDQYIYYNSEEYNNGIRQFEGNLRDILDITRGANVPVLLSSLTSNLKDQPPFISENKDGYPSAEEIFKLAAEKYSEGNYKEAESLYVYAKDLDALRFRAPSEINRIITEFAKEYDNPLADIYSAFNEESPGGITGNNLMTDHLHPDLRGYQLLGKKVYETMENRNLLPNGSKLDLSPDEADSVTINNFSFTRLDSTIAAYRIIILKNDWPFSSEYKTGPQIAKLFGVKDKLDSIALRVIDSKLDWEEAHRMAAKIYLDRKDFRNFSREMIVLMDQFPFVDAYYNSTAETLLEHKQFDIAYNVLMKKYRYQPDAFSAKWLGIIELSRGETDKAISYMNESIKYNPSDPQVLYNLAGAYSIKKDYKTALVMIEKCLAIDPDYKGADQLRMQLKSVE